MQITDKVIMLETAKSGHVFLVRDSENTLIDTGMPGLASKIAAELSAIGVDIKRVGKILLTHHDIDHIGSAKELQEASGAEVWAPALDVPYIKGAAKRPGVKRAVSALMRAPAPVIAGTYDERQDFGGIQAIHTPGHTPGHTILQYEDVIFVGDLLQTRGGKVSILPAFMNWDMNAVRKSVGLLKALDFDWLCPAHGTPIRRDKALDDFLEGF